MENTIAKMYRKSFSSQDEKEIFVRRFESVSQEERERVAKECGVECTVDALFSWQTEKRVRESVEWITTVDNEKLFDMAQWNENRISQFVVGQRFGVKLDKSMKRRRPQLKELAQKHNINFGA